MLPVDFRHKSHFFVDMKYHGKAGGVRTERLRDFWANDAFGRLLRSIIPNDDWHRCNKSRIFKDFISKWMDACSVSGKICEEQREQQFPTASLLTLFQSGVRQINDILTDIFSTSEVRQFDGLAMTQISPPMFFYHKQPNLTAVSENRAKK